MIKRAWSKGRQNITPVLLFTESGKAAPQGLRAYSLSDIIIIDKLRSTMTTS